MQLLLFYDGMTCPASGLSTLLSAGSRRGRLFMTHSAAHAELSDVLFALQWRIMDHSCVWLFGSVLKYIALLMILSAYSAFSR
jgi:hypothetical protein